MSVPGERYVTYTVPEGPWKSVKATYKTLLTKLDEVSQDNTLTAGQKKEKKRAVIDYWSGLLLLERSQL